MPYIRQEDRPTMDKVIKTMAAVDVKANGDLNYILYSYCKLFVQPSYNNYKNFCGELRQCATEIERRILGPYEDMKILENGDI